jgi:hypothetical protein
MKGGVFDRPECCNNMCECPVCLENKLLMRLNCNHYVCLDDIQTIISNVNPLSRRCPICREPITSYGCNGNIVNVPAGLPVPMAAYVPAQGYGVPNYDDEGETDEEGYETPGDDGYETDELYGGKHKRKYTRRKINKKRKTHKRKTHKRKTYKRKTYKRKTHKRKMVK